MMNDLTSKKPSTKRFTTKFTTKRLTNLKIKRLKTKRNQKGNRKENRKENRNIIEILGLDENRAEFIAQEGFNIRETSNSDGDFLKNLLENKTLNPTEKMLISYKVGFVDGCELTTHTLTERMNKEFEVIEKKMDKSREHENKNMYC